MTASGRAAETRDGSSRRLVVEADGGSRGNPGPAGYGAVVRDADTGEVLAEEAEAIGRATNNVAEYRGLIAGLSAATRFPAAEILVRMDSKLVVEQMSGRWKIKHPDMRPLALQAQRLLRELPPTTFSWIPREINQHADRLANEAMDRAQVGRAGTSSGDSRQQPRDSTDKPPAGSQNRTSWSPVGVGTTTLLLRHGQTEHSIDRRFSGRNDLELTAEGERQARAAGQRLRGVEIAGVVASPLRRTRQTADIVAGILGLTVDTDEDLVETDFGVWEGLSFTEAAEQYPAELAAWTSSTNVAAPCGESFAAVSRRVRRARTRILSSYRVGTVLVVSHVTPIKLILAAALDVPIGVLFRIHLDLASLSTVDWHEDGASSVRLVNDTSHLRLGSQA
ncbi:MAG: bifunctional RNase H/acid phosphatase [Geodermatophilaceae bacterium]|nr:bifunctional RNase H/acid phosphatase [Geodermatophilaceae bacterium]